MHEKQNKKAQANNFGSDHIPSEPEEKTASKKMAIEEVDYVAPVESKVAETEQPQEIVPQQENVYQKSDAPLSYGKL